MYVMSLKAIEEELWVYFKDRLNRGISMADIAKHFTKTIQEDFTLEKEERDKLKRYFSLSDDYVIPHNFQEPKNFSIRALAISIQQEMESMEDDKNKLVNPEEVMDSESSRWPFITNPQKTTGHGGSSGTNGSGGPSKSVSWDEVDSKDTLTNINKSLNSSKETFESPKHKDTSRKPWEPFSEADL